MRGALQRAASLGCPWNNLPRHRNPDTPYGPYWWGIKKVLVDNGVPLGECDDEEIRLAYSGATDEETIVMAEEFSQIRQEPSPLMTWTTHPMPRQSILADR